MGRTKREGNEFTILDAIVLSILPKRHRIPAIASALITAGEGFPMPIVEAHRIAALLTETSEEEGKLVDDIVVEVQRQLQIKIKRLDQQRKLKKAVAMGSDVDRATRINRVCRRIFGSPADWVPVGRLSPKIRDPHFDWLHRSQDGMLVAGVLGCVRRVDDLVTGFVYFDRRGPVRFVQLPSRARSVKELCVFLGLHPRLLDSTKVDWRRRAFIVAGTNHLPWVYP